MGFIGRHLLQTLADSGDHEVIALDNFTEQIHLSDQEMLNAPRQTLIKAGVENVADYEGLLEDLDVVVHLAAQTGTGQSMYRTSEYLKSNVQGTAILFDELARRHRDPNSLHIVLASSRAVYGEGEYEKKVDGSRTTPKPRSREQFEAKQYEITESDGYCLTGPLPTRESASPQPGSLYAASKLMQEYQLRYFCEMTGAQYSIFRLQNVYGPGQALGNPYTGVLGVFFNRVRANKELYLFEQGGATRDFVHVSDVVQTIANNLNFPTSRAVNIGTGKAISINQVAVAMCDAVGTKVPIIESDRFRLGDIRHGFADVIRLNNIADCSSFIKFEDGIIDYVAWAKKQAHTEDKSEFAYSEYTRFVK